MFCDVEIINCFSMDDFGNMFILFTSFSFTPTEAHSQICSPSSVNVSSGKLSHSASTMKVAGLTVTPFLILGFLIKVLSTVHHVPFESDHAVPGFSPILPM